MIIQTFILAMMTSVAECDFYSSRYDSFDISPLLENDRILLGYTRCFLGQGPCTPDAKEFKKVIPDAMQSVCGKCTPKQKQLIKTVAKTVMMKHPGDWEQILDKYDEDRKYRERFNKFVQED